MATIQNRKQYTMKWVKASERLPDYKISSNGMKISPNGYYYCKCDDDVIDLCMYKDGWGEFRHITIGCDCRNYQEEKANVIEWLDESAESETESELREQVKKLREGLGEVLQWVSYLPPLTAIAGVLIKECDKAKQLLAETER